MSEWVLLLGFITLPCSHFAHIYHKLRNVAYLVVVLGVVLGQNGAELGMSSTTGRVG